MNQEDTVLHVVSKPETGLTAVLFICVVVVVVFSSNRLILGIFWSL